MIKVHNPEKIMDIKGEKMSCLMTLPTWKNSPYMEELPYV